MFGLVKAMQFDTSIFSAGTPIRISKLGKCTNALVVYANPIILKVAHINDYCRVMTLEIKIAQVVDGTYRFTLLEPIIASSIPKVYHYLITALKVNSTELTFEVPTEVASDVDKRIEGWIRSSGSYTDPYVKQQIEYTIKASANAAKHINKED